MPDIGRWGVVDNYSENGYDRTHYGYVSSNPINLIDPDGNWEDDYGVDKNGNVTLIQETEDNFDRLYVAKSDKNGNAVLDSSGNAQKEISGEGKEGIDYEKVKKANKDSGTIISDLAKQTTSDKADGFDKINYARTSNADNVAKVFIFVAKNSNVEWGLDAYNVNGRALYTLYTGHISDLTPASFQNQSMSKLLFEIHSHKKVNGPSPINGDTDGDYGISRRGDIIYYNRTGKTTYPNHYLFYAPNGGKSILYKYHWLNENTFTKKMGNTINLKNLR